jgi:hypothetical protein
MNRIFGLIAAFALVSTAAPRSSAAAGTAGKAASFAPLFDAHQRFKPKKTFKLRFRATVKGAPVARDEITFSLHHRDEGAGLPARQVKPGVFEVRFDPREPGQYEVVASIRGLPADATAPVRLGVVGVADGMIELPPEADSEVVLGRGMSKGKFVR